MINYSILNFSDAQSCNMLDLQTHRTFQMLQTIACGSVSLSAFRVFGFWTGSFDFMTDGPCCCFLCAAGTLLLVFQLKILVFWSVMANFNDDQGF